MVEKKQHVSYHNRHAEQYKNKKNLFPFGAWFHGSKNQARAVARRDLGKRSQSASCGLRNVNQLRLLYATARVA